jgi:hypothetical protein
MAFSKRLCEGLGRALQVGNHGIENGAQFESCAADPIGKGGTVEIDAWRLMICACR